MTADFCSKRGTVLTTTIDCSSRAANRSIAPGGTGTPRSIGRAWQGMDASRFAMGHIGGGMLTLLVRIHEIRKAVGQKTSATNAKGHHPPKTVITQSCRSASGPPHQPPQPPGNNDNKSQRGEDTCPYPDQDSALTGSWGRKER